MMLASSKIKENIASGKAKCFSVDDTGVVYFGDRLVVPKSGNTKELILPEAHESPISIHPGSTKMYQDLRTQILVVSHEARRLPSMLLNATSVAV